MTTDQPERITVWQRFWPLLCALGAALFFAAAWPTLGVKSLWIDEMRTGYATLAGGPLDMSLMRYIILNDPVGPLYNLLVAGFCKVFGNSDTMLRLPSLAFMALSVAVFGIFARRFLSTGASFLALLLYMFSMNTLYFAQEARPYAMLLCWALLTYLLVTLEPDNPRRRWGLFALAFSMGIYIHIVFAFVIANCVLYEWLFVRRNKDTNRTQKAESTANGGDRDPRSTILTFWQNLSPVTSGAVVAALAYIPWFIILITKSADPARTPDVTHSLGTTVLVTLSGLLIGNAYAPINIMAMSAAAALIMWLYGLARFHTHRPHGRRIVLLLTFAPILLTFAAFTLFRNVYNFFHFRYLFPVMPFLLMPMASGLASFIDDNFVEFVRRKDESFAERAADIWLRPTRLPKFIYVFMIVVFVFCSKLNVFRYAAKPDAFSPLSSVALIQTEHQNWRTAYHYLSKNTEAEDIVILHGLACPAIKYYIMRDRSDIHYRCINDIQDITRLHDSSGNKWLIFYRDLWQPEFYKISTDWLKHLSFVYHRLPGLYGDIYIQEQRSFVLNMHKKICYHVVEESDNHKKTSPDVLHKSCIMKDPSTCETFLNFSNPQQGPIDFVNAQRVKGTLTISISNEPFWFPFIGKEQGIIDYRHWEWTKYDLGRSGDETIFKAPGNYYVSFTIQLDSLQKKDTPVADGETPYAPFCFELKREKPLKYYDTSSEKEYGDYLLNWIRK
jgi:uncharacterized membrane protein